jgi:hypothetical protein
VREIEIVRDTPDQNPAPPDGVKIVDLIHQMHAATARMSKKNEHRALMLQAMSTIMQLVSMVPAAKPEPPRVVLATADALIRN